MKTPSDAYKLLCLSSRGEGLMDGRDETERRCNVGTCHYALTLVGLPRNVPVEINALTVLRRKMSPRCEGVSGSSTVMVKGLERINSTIARRQGNYFL